MEDLSIAMVSGCLRKNFKLFVRHEEDDLDPFESNEGY
jgi:hypothetical protein